MFELLSDPAVWAAFLTLTAMEIILGIDNIVFLSVLTAQLDRETGQRARRIGLALALLMRIALLFAITWIIGLTSPLFALFDHPVTWRDIILIAGGLFLIGKGTLEIHTEIEGTEAEKTPTGIANATFTLIIVQIIVIDAVFSVDSILTAVGMADHVEVMIAAVIVSIAVMYLAAEPVARFHRRPSHHQDACAGLSAADRRCPRCRRGGLPYSARIHLFCHGVLGRGGGGQPCRAPPPQGRLNTRHTEYQPTN